MTPCFDERHSHAVTTNAFEAPGARRSSHRKRRGGYSANELKTQTEA